MKTSNATLATIRNALRYEYPFTHILRILYLGFSFRAEGGLIAETLSFFNSDTTLFAHAISN